MTYCVAIKLKSGLVFASDSRTNAGIDQVSCFRKMRSFIELGDRVIVTLCSGNLSITQNALNLLELQGRHSDRRNIWNVESMFDVAQLLGESLRQVRDTDGSFLAQSNVDSGANFLVGGQVGNERMRLFLVYAEGNFIEAGEETPFFQITPTTPIAEAVKCVMVSFDSTMRSNLSVGLPIDLACYDAESLQLGFEHHITTQDPYFSQISRHWGEGLRGLFASLPSPDWLNPSTSQQGS